MSQPPPIRLGDVTLGFSPPLIMGILNVTPDSFSDGGRLRSLDEAVRQAEALVAGGASIVDVGGESTRPGAQSVDASVELRRVMPVIERLTQEGFVPAISVDTSKSAVARQALQAGATLINDVSCLRDPHMAATAAEMGAALVLMHMRGEPSTMQQGPIVYDDLLAEVAGFLRRGVSRAEAAGVPRTRIWIDPGIGFGKTTAHNLLLTAHLAHFEPLGCAILYGPSRKRFLGEITGRAPNERDAATAAACALAVANGAHVVRVHEPAAVRDAVALGASLREVANPIGAAIAFAQR